MKKYKYFIKVGLEPSKKIIFISFNERALKTTKIAFYSIAKAFFVPKIVNFLSYLFDHEEKTALVEK